MYTYHHYSPNVGPRKPERSLEIISLSLSVVVRGLLEECEHVAHHVCVRGVGRHVLIDDPVDEEVECRSCHPQPLVDALRIHPAKPWDEVAHAEDSQECGDLLDDGDVLLLVLVAPLPKSRPEDDVLGESEREVADVESRAGVLGDGADGLIDLLRDGETRLRVLPAEELHDAELGHLAPVGAALGEGQVGAVVDEVDDGGGGGAVGEDAVLHLEDLSGNVRRGHHEVADKAKAKVEEAGIEFGEPGEAAVGELVHQ